jgi:hypothetical protein
VLSSGDFAVVQISEVKEGDPSTASAGARDEAQKQLAHALGEEEFTALVADLKAKTKILVHRDRF